MIVSHIGIKSFYLFNNLSNNFNENSTFVTYCNRVKYICRSSGILDQNEGRRNFTSRFRIYTSNNYKFISNCLVLQLPRVSIYFLWIISIALHVQKIRTTLGYETCHPHRKESFPMNGEMMATGNLKLQYLDLSCDYYLRFINTLDN